MFCLSCFLKNWRWAGNVLVFCSKLAFKMPMFCLSVFAKICNKSADVQFFCSKSVGFLHVLSFLSKTLKVALRRWIFFLSASVKMNWKLPHVSAVLRSKIWQQLRKCFVSASVRNISLPCNVLFKIAATSRHVLSLLFYRKYKTTPIYKMCWCSVQSPTWGPYDLSLLRLRQNGLHGFLMFCLFCSLKYLKHRCMFCLTALSTSMLDLWIFCLFRSFEGYLDSLHVPARFCVYKP